VRGEVDDAPVEGLDRAGVSQRLYVCGSMVRACLYWFNWLNEIWTGLVNKIQGMPSLHPGVV
jgi:hypothetical protein